MKGSTLRIASDLGISPYEVMKRVMHYRKANYSSVACQRCSHMVTPKFPSGREGMQCEEIGVNDEEQAWVANGMTCQRWKQKPGG
jgi:hypothetical protein